MYNHLYLIHQYPATNRYQEWWIKEFPNRLSQEGLNIIHSVPGIGLEFQVNKAEFSPLSNSVEWETDQMNSLLAYISNNIVGKLGILHLDLSFPGIFTSMIPLIKKIHQNCKIYFFCHATSINRLDYFAHVRTQKWKLEKFCIENSSLVFVSTEYHKNKLTRHIPNMKHKIISIGGLPIDPALSELASRTTRVENSESRYVVIPSRPNKQKVSLYFIDTLRKKLKKYDIDLVLTYQENLTLLEYYKKISGSKCVVLNSKEDTFGYPILESSILKVPILVNECCSYRELLNDNCFYKNIDELVDKIISNNLDNCTMKQDVIDNCENFYHILSSHILNDLNM